MRCLALLQACGLRQPSPCERPKGGYRPLVGGLWTPSIALWPLLFPPSIPNLFSPPSISSFPALSLLSPPSLPPPPPPPPPPSLPPSLPPTDLWPPTIWYGSAVLAAFVSCGIRVDKYMFRSVACVFCQSN